MAPSCLSAAQAGNWPERMLYYRGLDNFPVLFCGFLIITIASYTPKPHSDDSGSVLTPCRSGVKRRWVMAMYEHVWMVS